tara:strand:+ start:136676 stop:137575 length:900 start_codon:yes stop_codon:yes gene_type:complete
LGCSSPQQKKVLFTEVIDGQKVQVVDEKGIRGLYFGTALQSRMFLNDKNYGKGDYPDYYHLAKVLNPNLRSVFEIGMGGGTLAKAFLKEYPSIQYTSVEIDGLTARLARDYFHLKNLKRHNIIVADGRSALEADKSSYGAIFIDAYMPFGNRTYIPSHLVTKEFFQMVKRHLNPDGILMINVVDSRPEVSQVLVSKVSHTINSVFPQVFHIRTSYRNQRIIVGSPGFKDHKTLFEKRALELQSGNTILSYATLLKNMEPWQSKNGEVFVDRQFPKEPQPLTKQILIPTSNGSDQSFPAE